MDKKNLAVIFGGMSSEHDISCISATGVLNNIDTEKYNLYKIGITKNGQWKLFTGDNSLLKDDRWDCDEYTLPAFISPDPCVGGLVITNGDEVSAVKLDAVFPVLHGKNGEDGTVQGLLQLAQIPFVGCSLAVSAVCMDKALTNTVCDAFKIPQAKWLELTENTYSGNEAQFLKKAQEYLKYPIFIKPANAGSSVGITKAHNLEEMKSGILTAFKEDKKIVLEQGIDGWEVECAVLGNENPEASTVGEILPCNEFYDFEAKYEGDTALAIPAKNLSEEKISQVREAAVNAYKALGCAGMSRMDFLVEKSTGIPMFNEPNTLPGFTPISMYPKLWEASGLSYSSLIDRLIELAIERGGKI